MRKFLFQIILFVSFIMMPFVWVIFQADGSTDPFYLRFTSPEQSNLIIGTSASAQGLQPETFSKVLNRDFFNYSFTLFHSPFGPTYLRSIKKKINKNEKNGIFILAVTPLSIFSTTLNPNDSLNFRELNYCVEKTQNVNMKPNFGYFYNNYGGKYYKIFFPDKEPLFLHNNGWLEVSIPMDSISVNNRLHREIEKYKKDKLPVFKFSSLRFDYLVKTIEFLRTHGKVYLVRLPIHPQMMEMENQLMPDFEKKMQEIISVSTGYYDMTDLNSEFTYTDGFHLYKDSGKIVSEEIAEWIKETY